MATQAETLSAQLEQANAEMIRAVEGMSDAQWQATCAKEGRRNGVIVNHVAASYPPVAGVVQMIANGQPLPPISMEMIDQGNAQHAQQAANCTRAETLDLLRRNGAEAVAAVRGLTDEQLARTAPMMGQETSARQVFENILIGHTRAHLADVMATA